MYDCRDMMDELSRDYATTELFETTDSSQDEFFIRDDRDNYDYILHD